MSLQYLKKEFRNEVDFLHVNKHQNFLQVNFNTLGIKFSYKVILSLLLGMIKYPQNTQSKKFSISQKRLGMLFIFCMQINKFLQVGIIIFDGSRQICPKYQE